MLEAYLPKDDLCPRTQLLRSLDPPNPGLGDLLLLTDGLLDG